LGQGRLEFGVPILAVVNMRKAIAAVLDFVVRAEQADLDPGNLRLRAAAHKHVTDGNVTEHLAKEIVKV